MRTFKKKFSQLRFNWVETFFSLTKYKWSGHFLNISKIIEDKNLLSNLPLQNMIGADISQMLVRVKIFSHCNSLIISMDKILDSTLQDLTKNIVSIIVGL